MYESEIYFEPIDEVLPKDILDEFINTTKLISHKSVLHLSEHCTECAIPDCFKTCDLYTPRIDGKCQRFVKGMERLEKQISLHTDIIKIQFKQWGILETQGSIKLFDYNTALKKEKRDKLISGLINRIKPSFLKGKFASRRYNQKKQSLKSENLNAGLLPDSFLMEVYNPSNNNYHLSLTIRNEDEELRKLPFQYKFSISPGYNKEVIPYIEISKRINVSKNFRIDLLPQEISSKSALYFGLFDFVKFKGFNNNKNLKKDIKCVVWDLDNTIWDGILVEDGISGLKLKPRIVDTLQYLESKGIMNSISSKNDESIALKALKHFEILEYFIFPQISWKPKSQAVREIASQMNVGLDTFLFIDDSTFEREEVKNSIPEIRTIDALDYLKLFEIEEIKGLESNIGDKRKEYYKKEEFRKDSLKSFEGDYLEFLKSCDIELKIDQLSPKHFERVYELSQRTNQMNFSGNRYKKEDIEKINSNEHLDAFVLSCSDKFGDYGVIGFGIVNKLENEIKDLMFSCRIQSKRIEHAFIIFCLNRYLRKDDFQIKYKRTERNRFSAQVFEDLNFEIISVKDNHYSLSFPSGKAIPEENYVKTLISDE